MTQTYPADTAYAGLRLFLGWLGKHYARSTTFEIGPREEGVLAAAVTVGRRWTLSVTVLDLLALESDVRFEVERAAIEQHLDGLGISVALWAPRAAPLPTSGEGLDQLASAVRGAQSLPDGRREARRPVHLYLRRSGTSGSVVTVMGGLSGHWAQFTNRVPGSFLLNSNELHRLPISEDDRSALAERIVLAAGQPDVDDGIVVPAEEAWTVNDLEGGSCVLGAPRPDSDVQASALRKNLRRLLRASQALPRKSSDARALVVLGASDYASEEKLSWILRGMDPTLFGGYELLTVATDGLVKPLMQPAPNSLPWEAPFPA